MSQEYAKPVKPINEQPTNYERDRSLAAWSRIITKEPIPTDQTCQSCRPMIDGWCSYVENTKGKMLDEKCPRVAEFINFVATRKGQIKWREPEPMSIIDQVIAEKVPHWSCPDCGTLYFGAVAPFKHCPHCRAEHDAREQEYWDNKVAGMRSIASDIVAKILMERGTNGNS